MNDKMDRKLATYIMFGFVKEFYYNLGWDHGGMDLCGVGQEFVDEMFETGEAKAPYNDTDAILRSVSGALVKKYEAASDIKFRIDTSLPFPGAAIQHPYEVIVTDCVFRNLHPLMGKYKIRRSWNKNMTWGTPGLFYTMICPMGNMLTHAIDMNSDYLAGHGIDTNKWEGNKCITHIIVYSKKIDLGTSESENPEIYRTR